MFHAQTSHRLQKQYTTHQTDKHLAILVFYQQLYKIIVQQKRDKPKATIQSFLILSMSTNDKKGETLKNVKSASRLRK